jgi:hypothetical protein
MSAIPISPPPSPPLSFLPQLIKSRNLLFLSKRSGGALETQRWLVGDGSANPGGGGGGDGDGDGCLVEAVVLGVQVGRRVWKERRGHTVRGRRKKGVGG